MTGSPYDAMVSHDMVAVFVLATVPVDLFIFYYINRISLAKSYYKCVESLFKPTYPNYYTLLSNRSSVSRINEDDNNNKMFSINYGRICEEFLNNKHSFIQYCIYVLQLWSFCCGFLAFYASFIFWMNLLLQFFIMCTGSDNPLSNLGLFSLYFILEVIFWFVRRQFESLVLLTRNTGDIFELGLLPMSRIYSLCLCIICTLWTQINSDQIGWKYFILFMLIRGLYHQMIYVTLTFFQTVYLVISSMNKCKHFWKLICVVSTLILSPQEERQLNCCLRSKTKLMYIIFLWVLIIIYAILMAVVGIDSNTYHIFKVCIVFIVLYYVLIMFERGKYNALYLLWREKFSKEFLLALPATKSRINTVDDMNAVLKGKRRGTQTPELKIQMQSSKSDGTEMTGISLKNSGKKATSRSRGSKSSTKSAKFSMLQDDSDDDSDQGILINHNGHNTMDDDEDEDEEQDETVMIKLSPQSEDDIAGGTKATNQLKSSDIADDDDDDDGEEMKDEIHGKQKSESPPEFNNRASSNMPRPTVVDYRQYWDQVNFSEERRCKCFTLCTGECNQLCCKDYCISCCCNRDGAKWCFTIWIFILFIYGTTGVAHRWLLFEPMSYDENTNIDTRQSYPVCDLEYNQYLNVIDLVYLSIAAHQNTNDIINDELKIWFGANYEIEQDGWILDHDDHDDPYFYHIYNTQYDIDVVGIRSEPNGGVLLPDIALWSEVSMFQIFSWVVPLTAMLPKAFLVQYIEFVAIFENIVAPYVRDKFDEPVYDYIKENILEKPHSLRATSNDSLLLIVGHSLGGAVAQIVGARLYDDGYGNERNIVSFGLSTPGTVYSSGKFGFSVESLDKSSVTVVARRDIIGSIDIHGGFVQNIECSAESAEECHGSVTSFCELYDECSNDLIRNKTFTECVCEEKLPWDECM